jgi:light-regulated signal transduction histidine kinase (bacteriophytochrome)
VVVLITANAVGITVSRRFDLCKKIAERQGGRIRAESTPDLESTLFCSSLQFVLIGKQNEIISFLKQS